MDRQTILKKLPPFNGNYEMIHPDQSVGDIIYEVLDAHSFFSADYDTIALCFDGDSVSEICNNLFSFCKKNFAYSEQNEDNQQTMSPSAMLNLRKVDCKNYAGFCGGVLDALNRLTTRKINWCYRFASYRWYDKSPHHVFIVVNPGDSEIWIDPTPGADKKTPTWQIDKKVKADNMALRRVSGIENNGASIGKSSATVTTFTGNNINFSGNNEYANIWNPYLGLSSYRDYGGDRSINETDVANRINSETLAKGTAVNPDFVKWIYDSSVRSWNFNYPGGVAPGFSGAGLLPAAWPSPIITTDGRLTFDKSVKLDDYRNAEIHVLTAWVQSLINQYDPSPYPVKPEHIKKFSQDFFEKMDDPRANLFTEMRGQSIFKEVGKALEDTVNFAKDGVIKIVGSVPRNAFLGLVGLNVFGMATHLKSKMDDGMRDAIAHTWKAVGGIPDKLFNTIEHGAKQPAILGDLSAIGAAIGAAPAIPAWLAAAAPIIAIMLKFLDKDGKISEVLSATKGVIAAKYPGIDLTAFGFIDKKTGKPLAIEIDPKDDENTGGGNDNVPSGSSPWQWIKSNPLPSLAIGFFLWQIFAPVKYKLLK